MEVVNSVSGQSYLYDREFGTYTRRIRKSGGATRTFVTSVSGVRRRPTGEPTRAVDTESGMFFAVGDGARYFDEGLVGTRVEITWLSEGGSRATRQPPLILANRPQEPTPPLISWEQHHNHARAKRQAEEARLLGDDRDPPRARKVTKCPLCGRWVQPGDPIEQCYEGWCHLRCWVGRVRDPAMCPLCGLAVALTDAPYYTSIDIRHMRCVGRSRSRA